MIYQFDSGQPGAPTMSDASGTMATVLRACLIDGFGAGPVASMSVASGIATATYASTHPLRVGRVGRFAGALTPALNGDKVILSTTTQSVTFAAPGVADGVVGGSITSRAAPAGWQELFAGALANTLVLKSGAPEASGCVLRISDTLTTSTRVVGYESMSDINTGVGRFPAEAQQAGGAYWWKSNGDSGVRGWRIFADERALLFWAATGPNQSKGVIHTFGDIVSAKSGDAWGCVVNGLGSVPNTSNSQSGCVGYGNAVSAVDAGLVIARSYLGVGGSQLAKKVAAHNLSAGYSGTSGYNPNGMLYPNGADNSLRVSPVEVFANGGIRGQLAGVMHSPQLLDGFSTGDIVQGTGEYLGRSFCALAVGAPGATSAPGVAFVDITGPWR